MNTSQKFIVLGAIVAICVLPAVLSIKCYICNNHDEGNSRCGHGKDVDRSLIKDCDSVASDEGLQGHKYTMCRKITTWIDFDVNNNTATERIVRKCGYLSSKYDNQCYYRGGFGGRQQVCSCDQEECNSGFSFRANHLLMGAAGTILLLAFGMQH